MPTIVCQVCEEELQTTVFTIDPVCVHCGASEFHQPEERP